MEGQLNYVLARNFAMVEQKVIDAVAGLKSQGMGLRQIARTMSQLGIPTKCRGRAWHPEMVRLILENATGNSLRFIDDN